MGDHIDKLWAEYIKKRDKPIIDEYKKVKEAIEKLKESK